MQLSLDKNGYLSNWQDWTKDTAYELARQEHITLTEAHWTVLNFLRQYYSEYETSPPIRVLVKALKNEYGAEIGNSLHLQKLFPAGAAKQACKLAGLPKPIKCT